ncbi:sel1 repeat family protein [Aeromonas hydrophila]|nr:sel1 repeat family protein [Aeromonas hydrophila]
MYAKGNGVAKDDKQAALWFRKAAEQGVSMRNSNLGIMYNYGAGVRKTINKPMHGFISCCEW